MLLNFTICRDKEFYANSLEKKRKEKKRKRKARFISQLQLFFFSEAFRTISSTAAARLFFRGASRSKHTPVSPASRVDGGLPSDFIPAVPHFSLTAARPFFSPEQSAPCSLGISSLSTIKL